MLTPSLKVLSDATVWSKYGHYRKEEGRREIWPEVCERTYNMHRRVVPKLSDDLRILELIDECEAAMKGYKVLPSMRSAQFAGYGIEEKNERIYNCAYSTLDSPRKFAELTRGLLCGNGTGYSVQEVHTSQYDWTLKPGNMKRSVPHTISDDIEGWGDAIEALVRGFVDPNGAVPYFDYSEIRPKGAPIKSTGAKAPGPTELMKSLQDIRTLLERRAVEALIKPGLSLSSLDLHDIMCYAARCIVAGGIRRSAMIVFFDYNDEAMLTCKDMDALSNGANSQRYMANNSAVLVHGEHGYEEFFSVINRTRRNGTGEPGLFWTHDRNMLANPCVEASLNPDQYCNLSTISAYGIDSQEEFNRRAYIAGIVGTLQSVYTDFTYLGDNWKEQTEAERLIGVSITGIGLGTLEDLDLSEAASHVVRANEELSSILGIPPAARTTLIKPEGTTSCVLGTPSGIHPYEGKYYIRRFTLHKDEALYDYLKTVVPELIVDQYGYEETRAFFEFPIEAPEGALFKDEGVMTFLERVRRYNIEWIRPGHRYGANFHNVSCTATVFPDDWDDVIEWMWHNRHSYHGISLFPGYEITVEEEPESSDETPDGEENFFKAKAQLIFEEIDQHKYEAMMQVIEAAEIDFQQIKESQDNTTIEQTVACAGGACEVSWL